MVKRVLLTAGSGFIGANLARRALQDGHEVHCLVRPSFQAWRLTEISSHVQLYEVDFNDRVSLGDIVDRIRPDWIFHLARYGAYSSQTDAHVIVQTNFMGTVNLVEGCL